MSKFNVPEAPTLHYRRYENLKGMDCSRDITEIRLNRSPDLLNMISDNGGNPVKRVGWRVVSEDLSDFIGNGKHLFHTTLQTRDGVDTVLYAVGDRGIAHIEETSRGCIIQQVPSDAPPENLKFYHFNGKVYIFGNKLRYIKEDNNTGNSATIDVDDYPIYTPEVVISRNPDGTGGVFLESVNLLSTKMTISFKGASKDGKYYLYPREDMTEEAYRYIARDVLVEIMDEEGTFARSSNYEFEDAEFMITVPDITGEDKSIEVVPPIIKINDTIASPVAGQDNVRITFTPVHASNGLYKKERKDLWNANIVKAYGYTNTDRLFVVTGDRTIRYSAVNDPGYFPEDNYLTVSHKGKIVGLHRYQGYLVAVTDDNEAESTLFFISGSEYDGQEFFSVTPATSGIGAIAPATFDTLIDEPMFLSRNGVYAISSTSVQSRTVVRNRSYFIDRKLKEEPNLNSAIAAVWNNYYILCVNGHCYVLDGRNTSAERGNNTNYAYECYYWENVPAAHFCECDGELYFLSYDGKLCKFNTDITDLSKYSDGGKLEILEDGTRVIVNGEAIPCRWSTVLDDDGYANYFKTMNKKGSMMTAVPYEHSSVKVSYSKDGETPVPISSASFTNLDNTSNLHVRDAYFKKKLKKYKRLQLIFENDVNGEPFGLISVIKTYIVNNLAK